MTQISSIHLELGKPWRCDLLYDVGGGELVGQFRKFIEKKDLRSASRMLARPQIQGTC